MNEITGYGKLVEIIAGELRPYDYSQGKRNVAGTRQVRESRRWFVHDDYRVEEYEDSLFDAMGQNQINDIALVLAEKRFRFTDFVGPATLANREDDENVLNEKYFRIYGWGSPRCKHKQSYESARLRTGLVVWEDREKLLKDYEPVVDGLMLLKGSKDANDNNNWLYNLPTKSGGPGR